MKKYIRGQLIMLSKRLLYGFIFQLIFCTVLLASNGNAQRKTIDQVNVTLSVNESSLLQLFRKIETQSGFEFSYNSEKIDLNQRVTANTSKQSVYAVLEDLAKKTGLSFVQINNNIHVKQNNNGTRVTIQEKQLILISGLVRDSSGEPLPGVTILIEGTTQGTVTDLEGRYEINADEGDFLLFSFIGFDDQRIEVGNQTSIDVTLTENAQNLEEVIVIGYGEKSRKLMTESIGTVNSAEITKIPVASADQSLQGRISGVQVTSVDGTPGAPVSVRIRGVGTVGNTQPLFVVDGVPVGNNSNGITNPLTTINPSDIESISVLKDASAAAFRFAKENYLGKSELISF